jgi:hypothetical protein
VRFVSFGGAGSPCASVMATPRTAQLPHCGLRARGAATVATTRTPNVSNQQAQQGRAVDESRRRSLESVAHQKMSLGGRVSGDEQARWDSLDAYEQSHYRRRAQARCLELRERQAKQHLVIFGERARRHYAALSSDARVAMGIDHVLQTVRMVVPRRRGAGRRAGRPRAVCRSSSRGGDSGDPDLTTQPLDPRWAA